MTTYNTSNPITTPANVITSFVRTIRNAFMIGRPLTGQIWPRGSGKRP